MPTMDLKEFKNRIANGEELVVLDDLILDISNYQFNHPGGAHVLKYNVGRDISKFYYGGYQLENYSGLDTHHNHSQLAMRVVQQLVIGVLIDDAPEFTALLTSDLSTPVIKKSKTKTD